MKWFRVLIISLFLFQFPSYGYSGVVLYDSLEELELSSSSYELLEDPTSRLTIQDIISSPTKDRFFKSKEGYDYVNDTSVTYWLRFDVTNHSLKYRKWVIELLSVHSDDVQVFMPLENGGFYEAEAGMGLPFFERKYKVSNLVFDLNSDLKEQRIYVRIHSHQVVGF